MVVLEDPREMEGCNSSASISVVPSCQRLLSPPILTESQEVLLDSVGLPLTTTVQNNIKDVLNYT